jgi:hypothetical protein
MKFEVWYVEGNKAIKVQEFPTRSEAETYANIEMTQMEFAEGSNRLEVKEVKL